MLKTPTPFLVRGDTHHFFSLNGELVAQPCNWAVPLTSGTQQCANTADNGDIFDTNDCLGIYDGGDDYSYEITVPAGNDGDALQLDLTSPAAWTGIAISDGCPEQNGEVYFGAATTALGNESLTSDPLVGGDTYYIHISTFPSPQSAAFCLDAQFITPPSGPPNDDCTSATLLATHPDSTCTPPRYR
jgi:hypothetical protein